MLNASIDLDAALETLTKKQRLNDVHFTVRLVRDALRRGASEISLELRRNRFVISHDGRPLSEKEHRDLETAADSRMGADDRESALFALEKDGNLALLTALYAHPKASLSGPRGFDAQNGILMATYDAAALTSLQIHTKLSVRKAKSELHFYCRATRARLTINGRRQKARRRLRDVFLSSHSRWNVPLSGGRESVEVEIKAGLPARSVVGETQFFKHGVYYGVKHHALEHGRVCTAWVDSFYLPAEENFRHSVLHSERSLQRMSLSVYDGAAVAFANLSQTEKNRAKNHFLKVSRSAWSVAMLNAPLFRTGAAPFQRTLQSIEDEAKHRAFVAYSARPLRGSSLVLEPFEVKALSRLIDAAVKPTLGSSDAKRLPPEPQRSVTIANALTSDEESFVQAFSGGRFALAFAKERACWRDGDVIRLVFAPEDPLIDRARKRLANGADILEIQYWLLGMLLDL